MALQFVAPESVNTRLSCCLHVLKRERNATALDHSHQGLQRGPANTKRRGLCNNVDGAYGFEITSHYPQPQRLFGARKRKDKGDGTRRGLQRQRTLSAKGNPVSILLAHLPRVIPSTPPPCDEQPGRVGEALEVSSPAGGREQAGCAQGCRSESIRRRVPSPRKFLWKQHQQHQQLRSGRFCFHDSGNDVPQGKTVRAKEEGKRRHGVWRCFGVGEGWN